MPHSALCPPAILCALTNWRAHGLVRPPGGGRTEPRDPIEAGFCIDSPKGSSTTSRTTNLRENRLQGACVVKADHYGENRCFHALVEASAAAPAALRAIASPCPSSGKASEGLVVHDGRSAEAVAAELQAHKIRRRIRRFSPGRAWGQAQPSTKRSAPPAETVALPRPISLFPYR